MDYTAMSLVQLKELAKERKMTGVSSLKKADLIERLKETEPESSRKERPGKRPTAKKPSVKKSSENKMTEKKPSELKRTMEKNPLEKKNSQKTTECRTRDKGSEIAKKSIQNTRGMVYSSSNRIGVRNASAIPHGHTTANNNSGSNSNTSNTPNTLNSIPQELDSGKMADGILEVMSDGFGFIRCENYLPGENDVYVSPSTIRRFNLRTGDMIKGNIKVKSPTEKFSALLRLTDVNGYSPEMAQRRIRFEELTPVFPDERIHLENANCSSLPMRIMDLLAPVGKGQRGMIVSPPKAGKTTLLKQIAQSVSRTYRNMVLIVLLIDERPEEVTDIRESIEGPNVEVIYSTFDELPEHHKRVSEMVLERAKRLVEHGKDVMILLDSITRLARAYNLTVPPSGRTLSGGLDPAALHMPKKFFGAARNMRDGGSLTILATALVETGSKMDDVVFEEFKGTGNMELVLDRSLSEKRIFPAIDVNRSGTRRDDLLLDEEEQRANHLMHREMSTGKTEETVEEILRLFTKTRNNKEFVDFVIKSLDRSK